MDSAPRAVRSAAGTAAPALLDRLWRASPPLTAVGALMIVVAGASLVGLLVDPRVVTDRVSFGRNVVHAGVLCENTAR